MTEKIISKDEQFGNAAQNTKLKVREKEHEGRLTAKEREIDREERE